MIKLFLCSFVYRFHYFPMSFIYLTLSSRTSFLTILIISAIYVMNFVATHRPRERLDINESREIHSEEKQIGPDQIKSRKGTIPCSPNKVRWKEEVVYRDEKKQGVRWKRRRFRGGIVTMCFPQHKHERILLPGPGPRTVSQTLESEFCSRPRSPFPSAPSRLSPSACYHLIFSIWRFSLHCPLPIGCPFNWNSTGYYPSWERCSGMQ